MWTEELGAYRTEIVGPGERCSKRTADQKSYLCVQCSRHHAQRLLPVGNGPRWRPINRDRESPGRAHPTNMNATVDDCCQFSSKSCPTGTVQCCGCNCTIPLDDPAQAAEFDGGRHHDGLAVDESGKLRWSATGARRPLTMWYE